MTISAVANIASTLPKTLINPGNVALGSWVRIRHISSPLKSFVLIDVTLPVSLIPLIAIKPLPLPGGGGGGSTGTIGYSIG